MAKLNPNALAESGDFELDAREGVQQVEPDMIYGYVTEASELPPESALQFAEWLDGCWYSWNEDGARTNGEVIAGALAYWRGNV